MRTARGTKPTVRTGRVAWVVGMVALGLMACRSRPGREDFLRETRTVYGGIPAEISFLDPARSPEESRRILERCWEEVDRIGRVVNAFSSESEVGRLNGSHKTDWWPVSRDLSEILRKSKEIHEATRGSFDPTVWPLKRLYREARIQGRVPDPERLEEVRARVGMHRVRQEGDRVRFEVPDMALDLGGIAKGYAVDRVVEMLEREGISRYLVRIGGEIGASGSSPQGGPWRIGVQHPRVPGRPIGVIEVPGAFSVSTSGPYEQPVVIEGKVFHHILDPRTGRSAPLDVLGVTVLSRARHPDGARVDALATALAVLGPEEGIEVAVREGVEALFLLAGPGESIRVRATPGMEVLYRPLDDSQEDGSTASP